MNGSSISSGGLSSLAAASSGASPAAAASAEASVSFEAVFAATTSKLDGAPSASPAAHMNLMKRIEAIITQAAADGKITGTQKDDLLAQLKAIKHPHGPHHGKNHEHCDEAQDPAASLGADTDAAISELESDIADIEAKLNDPNLPAEVRAHLEALLASKKQLLEVAQALKADTEANEEAISTTNMSLSSFGAQALNIVSLNPLAASSASEEDTEAAV
ncbi:MAG: hypothetical protein AB7F28_08085 [Candidatus Margulisiibacteriota bacterium]